MEKGGSLKVDVSSNDIFSPNFRNDVHFQEMGDGYVEDQISEDEIRLWDQYRDMGEKDDRVIPQPVFIWAQTGKGKNHFVTNTLRKHAIKGRAPSRAKRILYVSNRVALDYQQKKELADLIGIPFPYAPVQLEKWRNEEEFDNITVLTYHKLLRYFSRDDDTWFSKFYYVVLDECHFFYSDALFNPHTGYILEMIVKKL